jgi:hypothetical protein
MAVQPLHPFCFGCVVKVVSRTFPHGKLQNLHLDKDSWVEYRTANITCLIFCPKKCWLPFKLFITKWNVGKVFRSNVKQLRVMSNCVIHNPKPLYHLCCCQGSRWTASPSLTREKCANPLFYPKSVYDHWHLYTLRFIILKCILVSDIIFWVCGLNRLCNCKINTQLLKTVYNLPLQV